MSETSPITEQANPETELARDRGSPEDLSHDALQTIPRTEPVVQVLEQINAELENLSVGAGRTEEEEEEEEEERRRRAIADYIPEEQQRTLRAIRDHAQVIWAAHLYKAQRRKGIEMAGSNIDRLWNDVEQMNDGGNSTHKTMVQRRKRIEMAPLKSGWTGAVSASAREQNNVDKAQQREPLLTGEFERANDLTGARIELPPDSPDDQEPLFLALDSVHHVDRIVPPTIDENYNRREATERLVQPDVCASAFVFYENHNAISTSQQENVAGDEETTPAAATRDQTPGRYFEEFNRWLMEDDEDEEPGEDEELLGPGRKRMAQLKSGWTLLMTSLIIEIASAVFDQLGYALVGMVLAFVALLVATADLIHMAVKERMSLLPIFHRTSTATFVPGKPGGTIVEYFGLLGAVWQCFYSTVGAYARQKKDNPIKMSLLPLIFFSCVVIYKLNEKSSLTRVLRKGIFLTLKKPLYSG